MKRDTLFVKAGRKFENYSGSMNSPIFRSSTIRFPSFANYCDAKSGQSIYDVTTDGVSRDFSYGSVGTPTTHYLANAIAEIEGQGHALIYPSGLTALTMAVQTLTISGDHILVQDNAYERLRRFVLEEMLPKGVEVTFFDPTRSVDGLIKNNTVLIMLESPASLSFEMTDIRPIVQIAKSRGIITLYDNSWGTPLLFQPLKHGVDISLYSLTKYISGHSDVMMGAIVSDNLEVFTKIYESYRNYGITVNSEDSYLAHRGLRTLHIRMDRHQSTAKKVVSWLQTHYKVSSVLYPALSSHPQHEIWKRDFSGAGGLFTIVLDRHYSLEELGLMTDNMKIFTIGASWGGCDSLILPVKVEPLRSLMNYNFCGSCIRVFCGLEDADDLIADLDCAFARLSRELGENKLLSNV